MYNYKWEKSIKELRNNLIFIKTSFGVGSGFVLFYNPKTNLTGVLTAYHVIKNSHKLETKNHEYREETVIKFFNETSKKCLKLEEDERNIFKSNSSDIALVIFKKSGLNLPKHFIDLSSQIIEPKLGMEVGLLSLISFNNFLKKSCQIKKNLIMPFFFSGNINLVLDNSILIDTQSRPGVSGSPVFILNKQNKPIIIGVVANKVSDSDSFLNFTHISIINDMVSAIQELSLINSIDEIVNILKNK